ncbi:MAG TPA: YWFCY domain-containing protein [Puia sp.]|nr:YWFCY domain-containing protein [Puia sp.]
MSAWEDVHRKRILDSCLTVSVLLLLLHLYYYCGETFYQWGWVPDLAKLVLSKIVATGFFDHGWYSKLLSLVFMSLALLRSSGYRSGGIEWRIWAGVTLVGMGLYFLQPGWMGDVLYMVVSGGGFVSMLMGGGRLISMYPLSFRRRDPFGKKQAGFPQEQRKMDSDYSINFPAEYVFRGKKRKSWVNVINARRGVLIIGSPGCGKSWFLVEPCMRQLIEKGMAMFLYDFKYPVLTQLAYDLVRRHKDKYPKGISFFVINFSDITRSHRCNVLDVAGLRWLSDAFGVSRTLLYSLNKVWIHKQGEFFVESPINFLAALIWYLRKYEDGKYCTLPHVIELAQIDYELLFSILSLEPEVRTLINPFVVSYRDGVMDVLDSQVSSAKIPLGRLSSPDLYYILTGNDCTLEVNDPAAPKVLCLGGDPPRMEALGPVLSLYIDQLNRMVNRAGRYPCALVCDEFATVRAISMVTTMATARSNNIVPVLSIQDVNQLRTQYSKGEADMILAIAGNVFCGQVGGETALRVSERFPKIIRDHRSVSTNSHDTSFGHSDHWMESMSIAGVATLSSGEFVGVVADDPGQEMEYKAFHARILRGESIDLPSEPLPRVREVTEEEVRAVYMQVKVDIKMIVGKEMARMQGDPDLLVFKVERG